MQEHIAEHIPPGYLVTDPPIETWLNQMLEEALLLGASDVHLSANSTNDILEVKLRIDGRMQPYRRVESRSVGQMLNILRSTANLATTPKFAPQEALHMVNTPEGPLASRVTNFRSHDGGSFIVFRLPQYGKVRELDSFGFSSHNLKLLRSLMQMSSGMIVFAGPMNSGKTTAAHSVINELNNGDRSIWSIEDPVERVLDGVNQLEVDEENGAGFETLLPSIVRSDYDLLFLGEIRDKATAAAALRQAKAGRQVITTIHANDNVNALLRLIELSGESPMSVLDSVRGVISQRLLGRLNPDFAVEPHRRYKGRVPVHEVLIVNKDLTQTFINGRPLEEVRKVAYDSSRSVFHDNADSLLQDGITDREEIIRVLGRKV